MTLWWWVAVVNTSLQVTLTLTLTLTLVLTLTLTLTRILNISPADGEKYQNIWLKYKGPVKTEGNPIADVEYMVDSLGYLTPTPTLTLTCNQTLIQSGPHRPECKRELLRSACDTNQNESFTAG